MKGGRAAGQAGHGGRKRVRKARLQNPVKWMRSGENSG
jgi:hypothetical protein